MVKLSIILPSFKDPYLFKTIAGLLSNSALGDQLEIIAVLDGYWPPGDIIINDPRVKYIHLGRNRGMRGAINAGLDIAQGEFIGRMDEHCMVAKGMDKILTDSCKENEIMTPRRYYLDPEKWEVMKDKGYIDYEDLTIQRVTETVRKFAGKPNRDKLKARKDIMVDETQAMQGSFWIANRKFFKKVVGQLQTQGYGPLIQDSVEVCMKYWKAGGRLMVNKNTWFAHKHRSFSRTHSNGTKENPANCDDGYTYALEQWEDYYTKELLPKWNSST